MCFLTIIDSEGVVWREMSKGREVKERRLNGSVEERSVLKEMKKLIIDE